MKRETLLKLIGTKRLIAHLDENEKEDLIKMLIDHLTIAELKDICNHLKDEEASS